MKHFKKNHSLCIQHERITWSLDLRSGVAIRVRQYLLSLLDKQGVDIEL
ncbi:MAG: hypothetical protein AAF944_04685 [Bacteroidota bacterium]